MTTDMTTSTISGSSQNRQMNSMTLSCSQMTALNVLSAAHSGAGAAISSAGFSASSCELYFANLQRRRAASAL